MGPGSPCGSESNRRNSPLGKCKVHFVSVLSKKGLFKLTCVSLRNIIAKHPKIGINGKMVTPGVIDV